MAGKLFDALTPNPGLRGPTTLQNFIFNATKFVSSNLRVRTVRGDGES